MIRYFTLLIILMMYAFASHAGKMSKEDLELYRSECKANGSYDSLDKEKAAKACLSSCPEELILSNNRNVTLCLGRYSQFKKMMTQRFDAPIPRVLATVDYRHLVGWEVLSTKNTEVSAHCKLITLAAANNYPTPLKGHQMMIAKANEVPVGAVATEAVLINVKIQSNKEQFKICTAEVVYLRCPPFRAEFSYCHP
jgi:hypothetical protein